MLAAFGEPPGPAWPLYFFTVGDLAAERIVYIGKTNAKTHRFYTGHSAITSLHRPEYKGPDQSSHGAGRNDRPPSAVSM